MENVNLADAKAHLSELVERAANGEPIQILRRGRPVARLSRVDHPRRPIDMDQLRGLTAAMPEQGQPADVLVREMRDADRY